VLRVKKVLILNYQLLSPIHHTFGPHVNRSYMSRVLALSYAPWAYRNGKYIEMLRTELANKFGAPVCLFASGREALFAYLKAINLIPGEEVIVQGYTCVVVPNAIHAAGGSPVFADIARETLNLDPESVDKLINSRTRAVICQHTFGVPSDTAKLREICDRRKILLIEDCAHVLPDRNGPEEIGGYGDALMLSFGRDKAISGITGGAVIPRNPSFADSLGSLEKQAVDLSWWEVLKLLEYAPRMRMVRNLKWTGFDKPVLKILKSLNLISLVVTDEEKKGFQSPLLHKIPNVCAALACWSLGNLEKTNDHRRQITNFFLGHGLKHGWPVLKGIKPGLPLQKFPLFVHDAQGKRKSLKKHNVYLDDGWTGCVVCPETVDLPSTGYEWGDNPEAEKACGQILSLPTHPTMTMRQAEYLARQIDTLL